MNKKNKKIVIITGISLGILIVGSFGTFKIIENSSDYEAKRTAIENGTMDEYNAAKDSKEQTRKIVSGFKEGSGIEPGSEEYAVISAMHKMTHQKIKSDKKWGAIPMNDKNIKEIKDAIENNDYAKGPSLMRIITKWEEGDFNSIAQDHNSLWEMQGGTVGRAYGTMTPEEEAKFIENNFK
jgi:Family of unknown function (DUF6241)